MHEAQSSISSQAASPGPSAARKLYERLRVFERPRIQRAVLIAPLLLMAPTIFSGFAADDYILQYELSGQPDREWAGEPPLDLYRLFDPPHTRKLMDGAGLPWWTYPDAACGFLRPISGFTHLLDQALAPFSAWIAHLQNLLWFALLLVLVARAYRELSEPPWVVAVATAMFALDAAHGVTVGWIVNRSAIVGAVFGMLTLIAHHRRRTGGGIKFGLLAWLCLGLGMFSTELTLGILGYLGAYALCMDKGSWTQRFVSLLPYVPVLMVWAIARKLGGYGTYGLYTYVDPVRDPLEFIRYLPERIALLLASQSSRLNSDLYESIPAHLQPWFVLAAASCCVLVLWLAWPALRSDRSARFWGLGALLSAAPMGATQPGDRLLTLIGVGVMPLLAHAARAALSGDADPIPDAAGRTQPTPRPRVTARAKVSAVYCALHLVVSPLVLPVAALGAAALNHVLEVTESSLPDEPGVEQRTVIASAVPDSVYMSYLQVMRSVKHKPRSRHFYWLVSTTTPVDVQRVSGNTLRVRPEHGFYDRRAEARSPEHKLERGDRVELSELTVQVVALTADGRPAVCDFIFKAPLDNAKYVWLDWRHDRFEPMPMLAVGEHRRLPAR